MVERFPVRCILGRPPLATVQFLLFYLKNSQRYSTQKVVILQVSPILGSKIAYVHERKFVAHRPWGNVRRSCVQMKGEVLEYLHSKNEESIMKSECAVGGRLSHYQRVTAHMYSIEIQYLPFLPDMGVGQGGNWEGMSWSTCTQKMKAVSQKLTFSWI